ncbi:GTP pyrophosphokinase [Amycolatopsis keratiniphila]|uniref:RelA/SpoT domain-containing protein n=1 Tax=Amycolatopsis keratiniphila subsp. keratiniphila TaxID=227715 RepID=A0A1W2M2H1_9PSEU|nr:RelA/SpoT domain-containing protein [Amycolatopsis keratiniphila]ONF73716.1 hypothetical protein AVR91_0206320 [Amycolatopsis keratiniphila subsp. keratiniphila]
MDVISAFIARYVKEFDFYDQAARLVKERLESSLQRSGVRCMVTSRAKDPSRLEEKCRIRSSDRKYASADDIFDDIADLAGVRVALYFPAEKNQVDSAVRNLFHLVEERRDFPRRDVTLSGKRFSGYSASHYRVRLNENLLTGSQKRYALARVEIQVASVLMHAWSEVEHDLVYKPFEGELSEDEYAILDQLNGMVLAGELALETLQRAGERRVAEVGRKFLNHYELTVHLLDQVNSLVDKPVGEAGLGRIDLLFILLSRLGIDTPANLASYLAALHGNLEERPLADQVIDAVLERDESRFKTYQHIQEEDALRAIGSEHNDDAFMWAGLFMARWAELEGLLFSLLDDDQQRLTGVPAFRLLQLMEGRGILDPSTVREIDLLRQMRNRVAHRIGSDSPSKATLQEAVGRIESIIAEIGTPSPDDA